MTIQHVSHIVCAHAVPHTPCAHAGNTCFVNVALQCLRYTPTLEQSIISDLLSVPSMDQQGPSASSPAENAAPSLDRLSGNQELQSVPESAPMEGTSVQSPPLATSNGFVPLSADASSNVEAFSLQHSMHSVVPQFQSQSQPPMHQQQAVTGNQHHSLPVGIPYSQAGLPSHDRSSSMEQLPGQSPDQQLTHTSGFSPQTASISDSPVGLSVNTSSGGGADPMTDGHMTDQPDDSAQPAAGTSPAAVEGDDSGRGPTNESTIAKQPQPVSVPRVPLRRGQIADSFKTLVKQASCCGVVVLQVV